MLKVRLKGSLLYIQASGYNIGQAINLDGGKVMS